MNLSSKRNFIKTMRPLNTSVDLSIIQSELINNQDDNTNVQGEDYGAYPLSSVITIGINAKF